MKLDVIEEAVRLAEHKSQLNDLVEMSDGLSQIFDNTLMALNTLRNYKGNEASAIAILNYGGALESLLDRAESEITISAATEGILGDAWDAFVRWLTGIWDAIVNLIKSIFGMTAEEETKKEAEAATKAVTDSPEVLEETPSETATAEQEKAVVDEAIEATEDSKSLETILNELGSVLSRSEAITSELIKDVLVIFEKVEKKEEETKETKPAVEVAKESSEKNKGKSFKLLGWTSAKVRSFGDSVVGLVKRGSSAVKTTNDKITSKCKSIVAAVEEKARKYKSSHQTSYASREDELSSPSDMPKELFAAVGKTVTAIQKKHTRNVRKVETAVRRGRKVLGEFKSKGKKASTKEAKKAA